MGFYWKITLKKIWTRKLPTSSGFGPKLEKVEQNKISIGSFYKFYWQKNSMMLYKNMRPDIANSFYILHRFYCNKLSAFK